MIYIFDTTAFITIFRFYYRNCFPSFWEKFDAFIGQKRILSTRENYREIGPQTEALIQWAQIHKDIFQEPTVEEALFVKEIYRIPHFQGNIEKKKLWKGGFNADAFVIAKAKAMRGTVVTDESFMPNAARIPNICGYFGIPCLNLKEFMEQEHWTF